MNYNPSPRSPQRRQIPDWMPPLDAPTIRKGRLLIIPKCPYCGKRHVHGASFGDERDFEHRQAHCIGLSRNPGYFLIPADEWNKRLRAAEAKHRRVV